MLQVKRAGHSTLTTPDIGRMADYFTRIVGLSLVARDKDRAILATKSGLEAIALERGDAGEAPRLSFQIAPGSDLDAIAVQLTQAGLKSERRHDITPGIRGALAFKDPKGTTLEIFPDCHIIGHSIAIYHKNPDGVVIEFFCRWIRCTTKNSATL